VNRSIARDTALTILAGLTVIAALMFLGGQVMPTLGGPGQGWYQSALPGGQP
jgi:hypothetical protein